MYCLLEVQAHSLSLCPFLYLQNPFFFFLMQDILSYAHEIQQLAFNREGFVCKTFCYAALIISLNYILHE